MDDKILILVNSIRRDLEAIATIYSQYLRIWDLECRREPASGLVEADWRPHSSEFSHLLIVS